MCATSLDFPLSFEGAAATGNDRGSLLWDWNRGDLEKNGSYHLPSTRPLLLLLQHLPNIPGAQESHLSGSLSLGGDLPNRTLGYSMYEVVGPGIGKVFRGTGKEGKKKWG